MTMRVYSPDASSAYDRSMKTFRSRSVRFMRMALICIAAGVLAYLALIVVLRPSNERDWSPDQARLATALIVGPAIEIRNVRNAHYRSTHDYEVHWEDRRYDLRQLESVWFVVEPFSTWRGPAHTLVSFGFAGGEFIAISVEIRRQRDESFSPLRGVLRQYEIAYVIGDERDLIGLRANHRKDEVFLYPVQTSPESMRALFVAMLQRANALAAKPEFYNTLTNSCTSNIVDHIELLAPGRIPFSFKTLLPAYSDDLAFDLSLIATDLSREDYRAAHKINDLALQYASSPEFSKRIRRGRAKLGPE